jgi:hypothetical protein
MLPAFTRWIGLEKLKQSESEWMPASGAIDAKRHLLIVVGWRRSIKPGLPLAASLRSDSSLE